MVAFDIKKELASVHAPDLREQAKGPIATTRLVVSAFFFSVFTNLLMLTGPLFMLQIYDRVLASRSEETLVALFLLVACLYGFLWILEWARGRVMARCGARLDAGINSRIFRASLDRAALRRGPAEGTLADLDAVRGVFSAPVMLAIFDIPWTPLFVAAIFIFHPLLGWLALGGGVTLVVLALINQVMTVRKSREATSLQNRAQSFARQTEQGAEVVWAQGMAPMMEARWTAVQSGAVTQSMLASDWTGSITAFSKAFRLFLQSAVLALGAWLVLQGQLTAGAMIAASILLGRALQPIELAIGQWQLVQRARAGWSGIKTLLAAHPENPPPTRLPAPQGRVDVNSVSVVANRGEDPVLAQVGFKVEPGQAMGVIGPSGSGKTTLARVLVGLVEPIAGEVRLGGATLSQYGPDQLGQYIGYLPQDVQFFDGTIAENIAQMAIKPDDARVVEAARKARVHDIVLALPQGYDTVIGPSTAALSGGQRQRLALARALYNEPVLLVLDEPNSALDAEGSNALNDVVVDIKRAGGSVIIMTHRPSAISACDILLVLERGRVTARGPRDDVIQSALKNADSVRRAVAQGGAS